MKTLHVVLRTARENWLIILAILANIAIAGPVAADWTNDVCYVNNRAVPCCTDCVLFCACGESPAP